MTEAQVKMILDALAKLTLAIQRQTDAINRNTSLGGGRR